MEIFKIRPDEPYYINGLRTHILYLVEESMKTRKYLADKLNITPQAVSWHIRVLKDAGLLRIQKVKNRNFRLENRYELTQRGTEALSHLDVESVQ